jgi:gas vesicle protein
MKLRTFINGMAYGFILGILFAPASGEETRKRISKKASDIRDTLKDKYNDIASTVNEKYRDVKNKVEEMKKGGDEVYVNGVAENPHIYE